MIQRRRLRRLLLALVLLLLVAEGAYVVGANGFLASEWGRTRMNRRPERFRITYHEARTWIPGRVRFRGLELAGGSRRSRWRVAADRGGMTVALTPLARREFRLTAGRVAGAEIEIDLLPEPEEPRPARRPGPGWRVALEDVVATGVRRVRLDENRLEGSGRLAGAARFQARGPTEIDVEELVFADALFADDEGPLAQSVDLDARIAIASFDPVDNPLKDILAGLTAVVDLDAEAESVGFLAAYLGELPWLGISGGGRLTADLEITRGRLTPRSRLTLAGPTVRADYFGLAARGAGRLEAGVAEDGGHVTLDVTLDDYSVVRPGDGATLLAGDGLALRLRNDSAAIDRPASGVELTVEISAATVPDLGVLGVYLPPAAGLRLVGGSALLAGSLTYRARERSGEGRLRLTARRLDATYGDADLRSAVTLDARLREARLEDGVFDISGTRLEVSDTEIRRDGVVRDSGWWGRIDLSSATLTRELGRTDPAPAEIAGRLAARLRDSRPVVALVADRVPRLRWLDRVLEIEEVALQTGIRMHGDRLALDGLEVVGGEREGVEIRGELDLEGRRARGVFFARWGGLAAAVELGEKDRSWHLVRPRRWYEERATAYRGGGRP